VIPLLLFIGLGLLGLWRVLSGYPPDPAPRAVLARREVAFVQAAAEALFPPSDELPLSGAQADLPGYADGYLAVLPPRQRGLVRALFALFEHSTLIWPARGGSGFKRFSSLSPEQRLAVLRGWERSRSRLRRMCLTALKAVLILGYVGHRESLAALGLAPWRIESPRIAADFLYPPIGQGPDRLPGAGGSEPPPGGAPPLVPRVDQEIP
jgi:hypothetical protein